MSLWDVPVVNVRPHLREERAALLTLLDGLSGEQWDLPTVCPGWSVKDVAVHILDDDLGWLSRGRDRDRAGLLSGFTDYRAFVAELEAKNQRWVQAARTLSPRVVCELLAFAGEQVDDWWRSLDLLTEGRVAWTGPQPVPMWFDVAQDLTERWVHQQQIRDAVAVRGLLDDRFLGTVLRTFVWALPYHYRTLTGDDIDLNVSFEGEGGGSWCLSRRSNAWDLADGQVPLPAGAVRMPAADAWRLLTGALADTGSIERTGDQTLTDHFMAARAIII